MFSVTKSMAALCVLQAVADGLLDLDMPVAFYWPEFRKGGKEAITLRETMSHQAGLVGFHDPMPKDIYYRWDAATEMLAAEGPWWPRGRGHGYHARTFGFLLGEILERVSGVRVGAWLKQRLAGPMGLDFAIGLNGNELARCADILPARVRLGEEKRFAPATLEMMRDMNDPATATWAAFQNPSLGPGYMNSDRFRLAEIPALNGHGTARSVAQLYAQLPKLLPSTLLDDATSTHATGPDRVLKSVTCFGLGLMLYHPDAPIGIRPGSFGHAGAGGSMAFYDPEAKIAFCFAMNQLQEGVITGGTSAMMVANAVYECLKS